MKKFKLLLPAIIALAVTATSCNNSGGDSTATQTDTTTQSSDTIKSDPNKFSDPH